MRGKNWTEEEMKSLKALQEDFPDLGWTALAKVGKRLGVCPNRSIQAMKVKLVYMNKPKIEPEIEPVQIEIKEEDIIDYKAMYEDMKVKYDSLQVKYEQLEARFNHLVDDVLLGTAELNDFGTGIFLNFVPIRQWFWDEEPDRIRNKIAELRKKRMGV